MRIAKLLVLSALLLIGSSAQAELKDGVRVKPVPATQGFVASESTATAYYLYNVKAQAFFTEGNAWGTQASVGSTGLQVAFTVDAEFPDAYLFNDYSLAKKSWKLTFFDSETAMYVDKGGQVNYRWGVQKNDGTFRLFAASAENGNPGWADTTDETTGEVTAHPAYREGQFVGLDASTGGTALSPYLTEADNHYIDWALVTVEAYNVYAPLIELYVAAEPLKAKIDEAKAAGVDVTAATAVYENEASTKEEIQAAIDALVDAIVNAGVNNATVENPADITAKYVTNPDYAAGENTGWSGTAPGFGNGCAEFYNKSFLTYQTVTGAPAGVYRVNLQAFYRPGFAQGGYDLYKANDPQIKQVYLYAKSDLDSLQTSIVTAYEGAGETLASGESEVTTDDGTIYIPNNMSCANAYFQAGRYTGNQLIFGSDGGDFNIGLVHTKPLADGNWILYDNWKLEFLGTGEDAYKILLDNAIANAPDYSNLEEGTIVTKTALAAYNEALEAGKTATGKDGIVAAVKTLSSASVAIAENMALWAEYKTAVDEAEKLAAKEDEWDPLYLEPLGDYRMDYDDDAEAAALTNDELKAKIAEIEAKMAEAQTHPKANANMTGLLKNPGFDEGGQDSFPGWTAEYKNAGAARVVSSCAEFWNTESFDLYQVIENAPKGVYEISVQGFYRYLRGSNAWNAYVNQDPATLPDNIPTYIYMNDNMTPFTHVFGDPRREELQTSTAIYGDHTDFASQTDDNTGVTYYFPDNMPSTSDCFREGMYTQKAYGLVAQDGDVLRLGVVGSSNQGGDSWVIFDNFQLTYKGFDPTVIKPVLETNIEKSERALSGALGKDAAAALQAAVEAGKKALEGEDGDAMFNALIAIFATNRAVNDSKAKFAELVAANENLANEYLNATVCALSTVQEAKTMNETITAGIENREYTDEDADNLMAQIKEMISKLHIPEGMDAASDENPFDATAMIINPTYDEGNNNGWTIEGGNAGPGSGLMECYNSNFDEYQVINGLPAGTYTLGVQAFYRYGDATKEYEAYTADPEANNNLELYVKFGDNEIVVPTARLASDGSEEYTSTNYSVNEETGAKTFAAMDAATQSAQSWAWIWMTDPVVAADGESATGVRIANGMLSVSDLFGAGKFKKELTFKVADEGSARIGLRKQEEKNTDASWCIWDTWTLTYYGPNSTKEITGITEKVSVATPAKVEYFNLSGARLNKAQKGIVIMKQTMSDGSVKVKKVTVK